MNFVKVKARTGEQVYINLARVDYVICSDNQCAVTIGSKIFQLETAEDIAAIRQKLERWVEVGS